MRERKYIKFRTNMYEDTKFKIIEMKPERDLIESAHSRTGDKRNRVGSQIGLPTFI